MRLSDEAANWMVPAGNFHGRRSRINSGEIRDPAVAARDTSG